MQQVESKLMVYDGDVKCEKYQPTCVRANIYMANIRNEMRIENPVHTGFLTVKEYSKNLKHI